jgi:hypothetical protein
MNFTESFQEFSSKLTTTDLALYAGVGLVLWVLFKDRLSPVQQLVLTLVDKIKGMITNKNTNLVSVPVLPVVNKPSVSTEPENNEDLFFKLVVSWKQTRDLAVKSGCSEAIKVADQMFPFLSPTICSTKEEKLS